MFGILVLLGPFRFSLSTACPDEISRSGAWDWKELDRIGTPPQLQYTGPRPDIMTLSGRIIPGFTGGVEQLAQMRALANRGKPLFLVDGMGRVHGNWVIETLNETGIHHFQDGMPRMVTFDISLKKYDDGTGLFGLVTKASNLLSLFR